MSKAKINLKIDAESKKEENICPECKKGRLIIETRYKPGFGHKTIFKSFCPVCGYTIKKVI
ncbi:MAG: hypothetical protein WC781_00320 [Candidatus Pacearchaeota archaeon]|jgi:C4-type Zn-finger protein